MKQNVRCTIEDVINLLKEKYLKEGEQALCNDNDWQMYVADDEWFLTTACCITAPPELTKKPMKKSFQILRLKTEWTVLCYRKFFKM